MKKISLFILFVFFNKNINNLLHLIFYYDIISLQLEERMLNFEIYGNLNCAQYTKHSSFFI